MDYIIKKDIGMKPIKEIKKYLENHNGYISGGCFKNAFNKEKVKDVDIFFNTIEDFHEAHEYYKECEEYQSVYGTENVEAFYDKENDVTIELIKKVFLEPEDMLDSFDFTITKFAYYKHKNEGNEDNKLEYRVMYHKDFFEHLTLKNLVIEINNNESSYITIFNRALKYTGYGYNLTMQSKVELLLKLRDELNEKTDKAELDTLLKESNYLT